MLHFKTALALKDKGFPQPEPSEGQLWYIEGVVAFCYYNETNSRFALFQDGLHIDFRMVSDLTFAPTATNILRLLPGWATSYDAGREAWGVFMPAVLAEDADTRYFFDENPAEACAEAYLSVISLS